jgi:hypothetical protein
MHVPLDEHLHTEECNVIIRQLKRCHEENSMFKQFFGQCNQLDWSVGSWHLAMHYCNN